MLTHTNNSVNNNFNIDIAQLRQEKKKNNFPSVPNLSWMVNSLDHFSHWTMSATVDVINFVAGLANRHYTVFPTQSTIAQGCGLSREHVNRIMAYLVSEGIITKIWRAYTSCIYTLHPVFNDVNFRRNLVGIMPNLKWLPLLLLVGIAMGIHPQFKPANPEFITLYINSYPLYIKKLLAIAIKKANNQYQVDHRVVTKDGKTHISLYQKEISQKIMDKVAMTQPLFTEQVIAAAEFLKLSMAGKCNISAYPDAVISIALQRIKGYGKPIQKPFNMLMKLCNEISGEMAVHIDRARAYQVATQFGITLGKDDNILPGCDKPLNPKTHKREVYKPSNSANKQFAAKSESFSSANTNTRPQQESFNGKWNLAKLKELNPHIDLSLASFVGNNILHVPTPNHDTTYRATTPGEREIWNESRRLLLESEPGKAAAAAGYGMPMAPMFFNGDCNVPATRNFAIQPDGTLVLPGMTAEHTKLLVTPFTRPLTDQEQRDAQWLHDYIESLRKQDKLVPSWYEKICSDIKSRADNLEKKLSLYRKTLEDSGIKIL
jgi:hypothetical protein